MGSLVATLEALLVLGIVLGVGAAALRVLRPSRPAEVATPRWIAAHHTADGATLVSVDLVRGEELLESRRIAVLDDADPRYERQFLEAMGVAEQRAALFNST